MRLLFMAITCAMLLSGCEQREWSRSEIEGIAGEQATARVSALQAKIDDLQSRLDKLEGSNAAVATQANSLADQVSHNAEVANRNALKDMTAAGACGKEWAVASDGTTYLRNKRCTKADLSD